MTLEQDHDRDRHHVSDEVPAPDVSVPGRASRSAGLTAPTRPLVSGLIQRKATSDAVDADAHARVDRAMTSSAGRGLPDDLRTKFERSLDTDLSGVRVHDGAQSQAAASSVGAKAFAVGNDIHFAAGQYDPVSSQGQHLIAHEVAHTVQQRGGTPRQQNKLEVSQPGDAFETAADQAADAMVAGRSASLAGASIGLARKPAAPTGSAGDAEPGAEPDKPRYPSWKDGEGSIPIAPKLNGNLNFKYSDNPGASIDLKKEAKAELFKAEYGQSVQIAPGITGSLSGEISGSLGASATAKMSGTWVKTEGQEEHSLQLAASGTGEVAFSATGSLQLSGGVGVANILALEGGIKGELTAKAAGFVTLGGSWIRKPDGSSDGQMTMNVGVNADLSSAAKLVVDVVIPGKRENVYEQTLGTLVIGRAGVLCPIVWNNGTVKEQEPVITKEWLPVPPLESREKRKLTDAEREKYYPSENANGASGADAVPPPLGPEEVELTDDELLEAGEENALARLVAAQGKLLPTTQSSVGKGILGGGTVVYATVLVDGGPVPGVMNVDAGYEARERAKGRVITGAKHAVISSWRRTGFPNADLVTKCAKTADAVGRALLDKHTELELIALLEFKQVPPEIRPCTNDDSATQTATPWTDPDASPKVYPR